MTPTPVATTLINLPMETSNTKLAAALSAVGIPLRKESPVRLMTGLRGDTHCFFFQEQSPCGHYKTCELILAWDDPDWHAKHPEHPFAYLKVAFENSERLTDYIRNGTRIAAVSRGSKIGFLSLAASDTAQKLFFQELKR